MRVTSVSAPRGQFSTSSSSSGESIPIPFTCQSHRCLTVNTDSSDETIVHSRLYPQWTIHHKYLVFIVEQNLVVRLTLNRSFGCYAILLPLKSTYDAQQRHLCEYRTSSKKPAVHHISQHCQRKTEPRPEATCTKFGKIQLSRF